MKVRIKSKKWITSLVILSVFSTALTGCSTSNTDDKEVEEKADIVLKNGVVQTMVSEDDTASAIAIQGDKIIYVGKDDEVESYIGDNTKVIDLDGKMLTPSFMDGHMHAPGNKITELYEVSFDGCKTKDDYINRVKEYMKKNPDVKVIKGGAFDLNVFKESDGSNPGPKKEDLDKICSDKPIILYDVSHHSVWVNSKTLEMAKITKDTKNPQGGLITKDLDGEVTGYLTDGALNLLDNILAEVEYTDEMYKDCLIKFEEEANSLGITGITTIQSPQMTKVSSGLEKSGQLSLRMRVATTIEPGTTTEDALKEVQDLKQYNSDLINTNTIKLFYDGVTEGGTAVFKEKYSKQAGKGDNWYGETSWKKAEFKNMVKALDKEGYQIHTHAIGDGAVSNTLDAYEEAQSQNGKRDARYTMTHVCSISDEDIKRASDLKVVSALQFLWMYADPLYQVEKTMIGEERALAMYPTKKMMDAGCIISGASDNPVTGYNPLEEIEVGVTRNSPYKNEEDTDMYRNPEQGLTAYQMLEIYTKNVAYENFLEKEVGTIEVGKKADLIVLDQNILKIEPKKISDTKIIYTIFNGKIVYENK